MGQAYTGILSLADELCVVKFLMFIIQVDTMDPSLANSTQMDLLNATKDYSLCTHRLSSLACLTSVFSDRLRSCSSPWHRRCSPAYPFLLSRVSRRNLSLALSRFIGIELHGEKFSVAFHRFIGMELVVSGPSCQLALNMNFEAL